jgi:hypothetical protein
MGNICDTEYTKREAKYYFNNVQDEMNNNNNQLGPQNGQNESLNQSVALICTLKNVDSNDKYKVELLKYLDTQRKASTSGGFTEERTKDISNNIYFDQFFVMTYYFEKQQLLDFKVYNGNNFEQIKTSLGSIMGSRKQTLIKKLSDGSDFEVHGKEIKKSNKLLVFNISAKGKFMGKPLRYTITNLGTNEDSVSKKLYDSEVKKAKENINFGQCIIPVMLLNTNGKPEENIVLIEVIDFSKRITLGSYKGPIAQLLIPDAIEVDLLNNNKLNIKCDLKNKPTFIDYLRSGMNINLTIGIDFTGSNLPYTQSNSYHYLKKGMNDYEKAIRSCGDILANYDNDQLFPVFGFGFKFSNSNNNSFGIYSLDNYPINNNINDPNIKTIDNVLKEYRKFITTIKLFGPTNFAPMINDLNRVVKKDLTNELVMNYNLLMILTDGQITDMDNTIDALVEASFLPISVIIVGIGNGDFGNMNILDADDNPLYDKNGRKADRDLVQFVPFNQFKDNPPKLAEQVLEEIPRQVIEYYQHKGIQPKEEDEQDENQNEDNKSEKESNCDKD